MAFSEQFKGFGKTLTRYFSHYGGWGAVLGSPLFIVSLIIALLDYNTWLNGNWVDLSKSLLPSLLGFSLGTYAILFSLLTGKLKQSLQKLEIFDGVSFLAMINASFFHFIFVQIIALAWAFVYGGTALTDIAHALSPHWPTVVIVFGIFAAVGSFCGFFLLVYSFVLILGAAMAVYRLAGIKEPGEPTQARADPTSKSDAS